MIDHPENVAYGAIAAWLLNKLWDTFSGTQKELVSETHQLTLAITELRVELRNLREKVDEVPEIRRDVDRMGQKLRNMEAKASEQ